MVIKMFDVLQSKEMGIMLFANQEKRSTLSGKVLK
jgi:hypothetical protein